jgi:hypothetical protein
MAAPPLTVAGPPFAPDWPFFWPLFAFPPPFPAGGGDAGGASANRGERPDIPLPHCSPPCCHAGSLTENPRSTLFSRYAAVTQPLRSLYAAVTRGLVGPRVGSSPKALTSSAIVVAIAVHYSTGIQYLPGESTVPRGEI